MNLSRILYSGLLWSVKIRTKVLVKLSILTNSVLTLDSSHAFPVTVKHNLSGLTLCKSRVLQLIYPLLGLEVLDSRSRVLVIGCRNAWDLELLRMFGFSHVVGADLISHDSKQIVLADMHHLKNSFPHTDFDCIVIGWTLSYSHNPALAASSIVSVCRPGSIVAISVEYNSHDTYAVENDYNIHDPGLLSERVNSTSQLIDLFDPYIEHIYFNHDAPLRRSHNPPEYIDSPSAVILIFSVK